jgi:hypothetical protein
VGSKADGSQFIAELLHSFENGDDKCIVISHGGSTTLEKYLEVHRKNKLYINLAEQLPGIFNKIIRGNICTIHT